MIDLLLALMVLPIALPAASLLVLTLAAVRPVRPALVKPSPDSVFRPRIAVLIPAHNESGHVLPTIECVKRQLSVGDRIVVIADNCTDDTATLARATGVDVIERTHAQLRGKGYALAFGVDFLRQDPPDVVMVVDADCTLSVGAAVAVSQQCFASGRPVQMLNLMSAGPDAGRRLRVLEFAMLMKNLVRPLGSYRLGKACHLTGTGMALPWSLMSTAKLATGHIAEDMKLGVDLAVAGYATEFFPQAKVSSGFPQDTDAAKVQKSRWEHGHLATLTEELPGLLKEAVKTFNPALIVMAMDLLIPPVALYFMLLFAGVLLTSAASIVWPVWHLAAAVMGVAALSLCVAIGLGWALFGRHLLSLRDLATTPLYALWKLPVYLAYALRKRSAWVRTKRGSS